ncbi:protein TASOR-like, partial [Sardina pilchardus]|uniref:protein TASOR-like n=1 Tax=Sardina pilchardus TaxID=27697 RepID=UPI002E14E4D6
MGSDEAMERDDRPKEGLMELVLPGSAAFDDGILPPLHNSYLYDDSRKSFLYNSAHLINNVALQTRYAAFRAEKKECGYTDKELEETFGFLLFDDENKATALGDGGLLTGHSTCSTLGDPTKGVYVSKYSDCLDFKPWYSGKSGHIAIIKLTKGRVKEVTENYTLKFTPPTPGFDCHESEQIRTVTAATSSFLALERTQYYVYEISNKGEDTERCPRHVYPFAIVEFSYGKAETANPETTEESDEKTVSFDYKPWTGQLSIESFVFDIGLKSHSGALIPAKLPEMLSGERVISIADLKALLPKEVFETCFSGDLFVGGKCCSLYEVIPSDEDDSGLSILIDELKEKELALVFLLSDSGVFVMLHSTYFLSYEDANSEEIDALYGLFIFPDSHTIQKDTKSMHKRSALSSRVSRVLPALNYAETEVEKSAPEQRREIRALFEQHLKNYGTLIQPGMQNSPHREASMFPDQYDVPCVFKQLFPLPKWTDVARLKVTMYFDDPDSFEIPVKRAAELMHQQQNRDDPDDEVYYYISSPEPEEVSDAPVNTSTETPLEPEDDVPAGVPSDVAADESTEESTSPSDNASCAALSEDLLKANTQESPQEQETVSPQSPVPNGVGSSDELSPENHDGDYPEGSPMSELAPGEDNSISDTEAPGTPLKGDKPPQGDDIESCVGVESATEKLPESNGQSSSLPASGCMQPADLAKDLLSAKEGASSSLCKKLEKPLEEGTDDTAAVTCQNDTEKLHSDQMTVVCEQGLAESNSKSLLEVQKVLEVVLHSVCVSSLSGKPPSTPEGLIKDNESGTRTEKALSVVNSVDTEQQKKGRGRKKVAAKITSETDTVGSLDASKDCGKDSTPSDQKPSDDLSLSNFANHDVSKTLCPSKMEDSPSTSLIAESQKPLRIEVNGPIDSQAGDHPSAEISTDASEKEEISPVTVSKSSTDKVSAAELDVCAEKPLELQSTSVPSDATETGDPTAEVSAENNSLHDSSSVSHGPSLPSDILPKPEKDTAASVSPSPKVVKTTLASEVAGFCTDILPAEGDSPAEMLREKQGSEVAVSELNLSNTEMSKDGVEPALSLGDKSDQSAGEHNSELMSSETLQSAEREVKRDLYGTKLTPSSDAAEVIEVTENRAPNVSPKPLVQEETGDDKPPETEDKAPVKPDWRTLPRRRRRGRPKRLLRILRKSKTTSNQQTAQTTSNQLTSKTTSKQQMSPSISPTTVVPTETDNVENKEEVQELPSLENDHSSLSTQNKEVLPCVDEVVSLIKKSVPFESWEHNYSQTSETSTEISSAGKGKEGKTLRKRNRKEHPKLASPDCTSKQGVDEPSVEIIIASKQVHRLKRKLVLGSLNHDLRTVITDCGSVFVPHGSEVLPQDVELVRKRHKSGNYGKGLNRTGPHGGSPESPKDPLCGEGKPKECLTLKDTTDLRCAMNVSGFQVAQIGNNPAGHRGELDIFPAFVLELDSNHPTSVTVAEQENLMEETDGSVALLSSGKESSANMGADDPQATKADAARTAESTGLHKPKRKKSSTYTVIPISELKTVFRAGKRSSSSGPESPKGLDLSCPKPDSKRLKSSGEGNITDGCSEESSPASVAGGDQGKESLSNDVVPSSEMASTSTKKYSKLLKKWQKINSKDIFRDQGAPSNPSAPSDLLDITCPEELQGAEDGILVQIQLESANEPWGKKKTARRGRADDAAGPSSCKKPCASGFRKQRDIVQKGESIEISRQWEETYDFSLDSKFRKNARDETVLRALHGPWDFKIKDSDEEIHLIFHMWIGLFYSKSAPRFFHLDSDFSPPEEGVGVGGSKSPRDVHLQLAAAEFSKASATSTPRGTTNPIGTTSMFMKALPPRMPPFESFVLPAEDVCPKASGSQPQPWPESPSCEVLDLSLKSCKALDLTCTPSSTPGVESASGEGGSGQSGEVYCDGPLDLRIEPVCARAQPQLKVGEETCDTVGTTDESKNTTTDTICTNIDTSCPSDLSEKTKVDFFDRLREDQNPVVTQDGEIKYRFFILATSEDPFFRETKERLESAGHVPVEPDQFELETCSHSSPLLIIVRNEDIAEHICEVPHLLELKKSSGVVFAGVDRPDDIQNLTHEELFSKGGFLMFDAASLKKLTLESMKRTTSFLEELSRKGKWKWCLHYRDSRGLREEARTNEDARGRKQFLDSCQEAGLVEVLPYHDCDVMSQERPDYLRCLVRLQVQNATRRFPEV